MKYVKFLILISCLTSGFPYIVSGQVPGNPTTSGNFVLKNSNSNKIKLAIPTSGVTDYTLTFPSIAGGQGALLFANNATGTLGWLTAGSSGQVLSIDASGNPTWITSSLGGVSSVGLSMPSVLYSSVTNSPITSSGVLMPQLAKQIENTVFAGPVSGSAATPTFRALTSADIPSLSGKYIANGTSVQSANFNITGNGAIAGQLQLQGTSTGVTTFAAGAQGLVNIHYTLPVTQGTGGSVLQNNGAGTLSWVDQSSQVGAVKFVVKGTDESVTNTTTLQNDNELSFTIGANEKWELITQLDVVTNCDSDDHHAPKFKVAVTIPSGVLHVYAVVTDGEGDSDDGGWLKISGTAQSDAFEINGQDDQGPILLQGIIAGGATGGTVHIQWAPDKSTSKTVSVKANSYLKATKIQ